MNPRAQRLERMSSPTIRAATGTNPPFWETLNRQLQRIPRWTMIAAVVLTAGAALISIGMCRLIDDDEGSYLLASQLAMQGRIPYHDFAFCQMPLTPYFYGAWIALFGTSWYAARMLSAILTTGLSVLLYIETERQAENRISALLAVVLFISSSLVFGWCTLIKTYGLSMLFSFGAYMLADRACSEPRPASGSIVSGLLLGLATDTRLFYISLFPLFVLALLSAGPIDRRKRNAMLFAGGYVAAMLPLIAFLFVDAPAFWFGNLGIHAIRTKYGLIGNMTEKIAVVLRLVGLQTAEGGTSFQTLALLALNVSLFSYTRVKRIRVFLSLWIVLALGLVSLVPTPVYIQYFVTLVPFSIVNAILFLTIMWRTLKTIPLAQYVWTWMTVVLAVTYVAAAPLDACNYIGLASPWQLWPDGEIRARRIDTITHVTTAVDALTQPGERVFSTWPGYAVGAHWQLPRGLESNLGSIKMGEVSAVNLDAVGMMSRQTAEDLLRKHAVRVVVIGLLQTTWDLLEVALGNGYRIEQIVGGTRILLLSTRP